MGELNLLDSLITSKTRLKLLMKFFLNQDTQAYLQELSTEFGESSNGIRIELNRLSAAKLLKTESKGRTIVYQANTKHKLFQDICNVVRKNVGIDLVIEDILTKIGRVEAAWITGDYAKGVDSGLIDLAIVGEVNLEELHIAVKKTEKLIQRKIRLLVLEADDYESLKERLDLAHALPVWGSPVMKNDEN
jgi:hypothetical protein